MIIEACESAGPMDFDPTNPTIRLCVQAMVLAQRGDSERARSLLVQAWGEAGHDFEKFIVAYHVARQQPDVRDRLAWFETSLQCALRVDGVAAASAVPFLHANIAECHEELGDSDRARTHRDQVIALGDTPSDPGPFFHGTRADLAVGDLLTAGRSSNYQAGLAMNHIYFTALPNGAGLAAALARGDARERVYVVEPTGAFEHDPNVTNKRFPGNPTRSYRSGEPLRIVGELTDWVRPSPEEVRQWRERLASAKGDIIN